MGKEMINEVEFLIKMLEEEWSVSKEINKIVKINKIYALECINNVIKVIDDIKEYMKFYGTQNDFNYTMEIVKRCYIVWRLVYKIKKSIIESREDEEIILMLDKEEYMMYQDCFC